MNTATSLVFFITANLITTLTTAVDTSDLNHLINLDLQQQQQHHSSNSINLEQLEHTFFKKCYANDADENVKQMQREFAVIEDRLEYLRKWYKPDDFCVVNEQIKSSVYNFANYAKDCLPAKDIKQANVLNRIIKIIDDFFCFKDGDRLLMFLAESGDDCLKNSEETLQRCGKDSFGVDFNSAADFGRLLYFFMAANKCSVMDNFRFCITTDIEKNCKSTAGRILIDIFDNVKSASSCNKTAKHSKRDVITDDETKLHNFFKNKCSSYDYDIFLKGVSDLSFCFETGYQRAHTTADPREFCKLEEKQLKNCFYDAIDKVSSCFKNEESFLRDFLKKSLKSMLKFVCNDNAKHLREYFSDSGKKCSKRIIDGDSTNNNSNELAHCLDRVFSPSGKSVTENELCRDLEVAEECTFRYINKTCPGNKMYQELSKGFVHSLQAPCGSCCLVSWNIFVFVFICFVTGKLF